MQRSDGSRQALLARLHEGGDQAEDILMRLLAAPSENPPGDTTALAQEIKRILSASEHIDARVVCRRAPIDNVLAVVRGGSPGRRLVFNGHLDTFEIGDRADWSWDPLGERAPGRIYGRGAADMKGGLAAQIYAMLRLAEVRDHWSGELVLVLTAMRKPRGPTERSSCWMRMSWRTETP